MSSVEDIRTNHKNTTDEVIPMPEKPRNRITRTDDGFVIEAGHGCQRVRVTLLEACWCVQSEGAGNGDQTLLVGLFDVNALVRCIAEFHLTGWTPRSEKVPPWKITAWKLNKVRYWVAKLVAEERQRLVDGRIDPTIIQVQRANFAACLSTSEIYFQPDFYRLADRYLLEDIQRYRAAAIAVNTCVAMAQEDEAERGDDCEELSRPALAWGDIYERLRSWRCLFSDTGRTYRSLNQTLDHLPGRMSPGLVCRMRFLHLERGYRDRVELTVCLLGARESAHGPQSLHQQIFAHATRNEIERAMKLVSGALHAELRSTRTGDLGRLVQYLRDFPEVHHGRIVGLAEASIRYHRELAEARISHLAVADRPVALPPLSLPEVDGLRFLRTTGEIVREGLLMGHCIGNYAGQASEGHSFLFHFDYQNEMASIEVDWRGRVRQSYGPRNSSNRAAVQARKILSLWGRQFPTSSAAIADADDEFPF